MCDKMTFYGDRTFEINFSFKKGMNGEKYRTNSVEEKNIHILLFEVFKRKIFLFPFIITCYGKQEVNRT